MIPRDRALVTTATSPLRTERHVQEIDPGITVAELVRMACPAAATLGQAAVTIQGQPIPPMAWPGHRVRAGDRVEIRTLPSGGGSTLRSLLVFAAISWMGGLGGAWARRMGLGRFGQGLLAGIFTLGALLAVNAIAPPPLEDLGQLSGSDTGSTTYSIHGARNTARPYGPIPLVLGTHLVVPPYAAQPYTELVGDDQYLRLLFVVGYGPLSISDIKIGETAIDDFSNVEYEVREGYDADPPVTLFPSTVDEDTFNTALTDAAGWQQRTGEDDADQMSIDIQFPQGCCRVFAGWKKIPGGKYSHTVAVDIEYRLVGAGAWTSVATITVTSSTTEPIRRGHVWTVPKRGQYEVRLERTTADSSDTGLDTFYDKVYWTAMRTITNEDPVSTSFPVAKIAVRIKATDQLTGIVDQLNCIASSVIPDWQADTSTWVTRATSNPASIYRQLLQGPASRKPVADARLDLATLQTWHEANTAADREFNAVFDSRRTLLAALKSVCSAGRASFGEIDGKYSAIRDYERDTPVQLFTPRNTKGFQLTQIYHDQPHALRIKFINQDNSYRQDERIVYDDGYDESDATDFETLSLFGVTDPDQVYRDGRYHLACARLRPARYTFECDFERLICTRGDMVLWQHDVTLQGIASGRVTAVGTGYVDLDEQIEMEGGKSYGLQCRAVDGSIFSWDLHTAPGLTHRLHRDPPASAADYAGGTCYEADVEPDVADPPWIRSGVDHDVAVGGIFTISNAGIDECQFRHETSWDSALDLWVAARIRVGAGVRLANIYMFLNSLAPNARLVWRFNTQNSIKTYGDVNQTFSVDGSIFHVIVTRCAPGGWTIWCDGCYLGSGGYGASGALDRISFGKASGGPDDAAHDWDYVRYAQLPSSTLATGDLVAFGELGSETVELVAQSITPTGDMGARLVCVDHAPAIYTADTGEIPAYDGQMTKPRELRDVDPPRNLAVVEYLYEQGAVVKSGVTLSWRHAEDTLPDGYEVQYRPPGDAWHGIETGTVTSADIRNTEPGDYDFRVRAVTRSGLVNYSSWSDLTGQALVGLAAAPDNVTNLRAAYRGGKMVLVWDPVIDLRTVTYEVRTGSLDWDTSRFVSIQDSTEIAPNVSGDWTVKAKAGGGYSATAAALALGDVSLSENVVVTVTEHPAWDGDFGGYLLQQPMPVVDADYRSDHATEPDADGWTLVGVDHLTLPGGYLRISGAGMDGNEYRDPPGVLAAGDLIHFAYEWICSAGYTGHTTVRITTGTHDFYTFLSPSTLTMYDADFNLITLINSANYFTSFRAFEMTARAGYGAIWHGSELLWSGPLRALVVAADIRWGKIAGITDGALFQGWKHIAVGKNGALEPLLIGNIGLTGTYETDNANIVDLGYEAVCAVTASLTTTAIDLDYDLLTVADLLVEPNLLVGNAEFECVPEIRTAGDDAVYGSWEPLINGDYVARYFDVRLNMSVSDDRVIGVVNAFEWTVDMPDRIDSAHNVAVAACGVNITYSPAFQAIPSLTVTCTDMVAGDHVEIHAQATTGFTAITKNGGAGVARTIDWIARGY